MTQGQERAVLGIALIGGTVLRLIHLAQRPIWYDEAFSLLLARRPVPDLLAGTAADTMPPLYYLLLKGWLTFGSSIAYARLLNVLLGVGLLALAYFVGRAYFDGQAGAWAALVLAASPFLIYHAQELRMYTLLAIALAGYALGCHRLLQPVRQDDPMRLTALAAVALTAAAALYTHNLAAFTLLVPNLVLLARRRWQEMRLLISAQVLAAVLFLPWLWLVPGQIQKIQAAFWTPRPGLLELVQALLSLHTNLPLPDELIPLAAFGALFSLVLVVYGLIRARGPAAIALPAAFALAPPALLFIASYVMRPVFVPRAFIFSLVAYALLIGWLTVRPPLPGFGVVLLAGFIAPALISLPSYYTYQSFPRSPFPEAVSELPQSIRPNERIVHDNKLSYFPMVVYDPDLPMVFLADEPGSHNDTLAAESAAALGLTPLASIEDAVGSSDGVWFVVFQRALDEYRALGLTNHPVIEWLNQHYAQLERRPVGDLWLLHYGPSDESTGRPPALLLGSSP